VIERIRQLSTDLLPELRRLRQHLHEHPELSFQEHTTAEFVAAELRALDMEVREGLAPLPGERSGTGVIGVLKGKGEGLCVALRADMDALPIIEDPAHRHRSKNEGVMHACGHDVHMTCVLGAARILHALRDEWSGSVMFVLQPGEEKIPGGANLLVQQDALRDPRPSGILGQHVTPELAVGKIGFREGPFMASSDELYITVKGRGGHAAQPEKLVDPIVITAHLLLKLKEEFAANWSAGHQPGPQRPIPVPSGPASLLAFGQVIADGATNVVPNEVRIAGTLRAFDEALRMELHDWLPKRAREMCQEFRGDCEFEVRKGYPVLVNDEALTSRMRSAAEMLIGKENVVRMDQRMGSEDFAFYTHQMPGCFFRLGTASASENAPLGVHTPVFDIDDDALRIGAAMMAWGAISELRA
jgi:amidohydrolase